MTDTAPNEKVAEFIEVASPAQKLEQMCVRITRCYRNGQTVAVYAPDTGEAAELDNALWTFRQNSFVPHVRLEEADEPLIEPVLIFSGKPGDLAAEVLFFASVERDLSWFVRFPHIYDFAPVYDDELKASARQRFNTYKEAGYRMRFIQP
jgi:DNA polymerase-3 subunit chi